MLFLQNLVQLESELFLNRLHIQIFIFFRPLSAHVEDPKTVLSLDRFPFLADHLSYRTSKMVTYIDSIQFLCEFGVLACRHHQHPVAVIVGILFRQFNKVLLDGSTLRVRDTDVDLTEWTELSAVLGCYFNFANFLL